LQARNTVFGQNSAVSFRLSDGSAALRAGSVTFEMLALADGWWRISISGTATVTTTSVDGFWVRMSNNHATAFPNYLGDGASGFFLWGAQIEDGPLSSYIPTGATAATRSTDAPVMQGVTATLNLAVKYGDGSTATLPAQSVTPSFWPTLSQTRIRQIVGRT
jgi:hypothetical protein